MNNITITITLIILILIYYVLEIILKRYLISKGFTFPASILRLNPVVYLKSWIPIIREPRVSAVKVFICVYLTYYILTLILTILSIGLIIFLILSK